MKIAKRSRPAQNKKTRLRKKAIYFGAFFLLLFSFAISINTAFADEKVSCKCRSNTLPTKRFDFTIVSSSPTPSEKSQCAQMCTSNKYESGEIVFKGKLEKFYDLINPSTYLGIPETLLKDTVTKGLVSGIKFLLIVILQLLGWFFDVAMALFAWIADANNLNRVLSNEGVYFGWTTVRDLLNISFILILLFTAFAIVFQIDKYNKKTTILNLVIMALLINFSFPITRAIIDASNILMYTIIKNISGGTNALGMLTGATGIQNIIDSSSGATITSLIASIIFVFILMITMLAISLMFVIRIVALALLIIFSPIAFVPLPGNNYGADWWKNLFKYCFFGPIMMFMILIATQIMSYMDKYSLEMKKIASSHTIDNAIVGDMAYFAIPIVILWIGMGMAQKMGVEGASAVMGRAQKVGKWAGKKFSGYNFADKRYGAYKAERKKRADDKFKGNWGTKLGEGANKIQDTVYGKVTYTNASGKTYGLLPGSKSAKERAKKMRQEKASKDVEEKAKELKDSGTTIDSMSLEANSSFDATTGNVNSNVTKDQAASAKAFMDKHADDRRTHIEDSLLTKGGTKTAGVAGSGLQNILAGAPPNIQQAIATITGAPALPPPAPAPVPYQDALRQVTSYISNKSESVIQNYTK